MKKVFILLLTVFFLISCKNKSREIDYIKVYPKFDYHGTMEPLEVNEISIQIPNALFSTDNLRFNFYLIEASEFEYVNDTAYSKNLMNCLLSNNFHLSSESIFKDKNDNKYYLFKDTFDCISGSYKIIDYNNKIIGERGTLITGFDNDSDGFSSIALGEQFFIVLNDYLVVISFNYYNKDDKTLFENFPDLFIKKDNDKYMWKYEDAVNYFYNEILIKNKSDLPMPYKLIKLTEDSILESLYIDDNIPTVDELLSTDK